ncbi:LamG-like jellyroll fold domain-containing protein [Pontibacter vulgaris]|uniref:LamG-like jellyroll fold domain-containing protein n=1 Tax=Pontibacter vulgaris TaxID=2905679 RepID=UPI001FA77C54|nr:LamG-like jellyroll fold domain-containing protein [Pontibacter vulgaris]
MKTVVTLLLSALTIFSFFSVHAQGPVNAIRLDGMDDYIDCGTSNRNIKNIITAEAWVKTGSFKYHWVLGKYDRYSEGGYHLIIKDGKAAFAGRDGSGNYKNSGYSSVFVNDNNWHHLAGICNNGIWQIYVDGILQSQFISGYPNTDLTSTAPLAIGKDFVSDNETYTGQIDEVRIWRKALTESEIRKNMCQKISPTTADLVAYYRFDASSGTLVEDLSSSKINGTFRNMTSAAWTLSGAPIGDKSVYRYTDNWNASLEMVTDIANFSVTNIDQAIKGFHLYQIASPPTNSNGIIPNPQEVKEYYGLFKVGDSDKKYKIWFKQYALYCGGKLFRRSDNSASTWGAVADTVNTPVIVYNASANYGEFAAISQVNAPLTITGPNTICSGATATLSVAAGSGETIKWSTGATTPSITISSAGTYWAEATNSNGCTARSEIKVAVQQEPYLNWLPEYTIYENESVMLDATVAGATYLWNNGQTTPTLQVVQPGTYRVNISLNGCNFLHETVVKRVCPIIPNIITPNGDGNNDAFVVEGADPSYLEIEIFNRWGKCIYKSARYDNNWSAANVPTGVYYYQLTSRQTKKVYKGWLEVLR